MGSELQSLTAKRLEIIMYAIKKKMQHVENDLDNTLEKLGQTNVKFDEKDKAFQLAEGETQALQRKLVLLQDEHQRSENKLAQTTTDLNEASTKTDESKIVDLEEELKVIGENLKALEVAEEKAQQREEEYKRQIKNLTERLKTAESRAEYGEKTVQKLNLRIDNIMYDLVQEKTKTQTVNEEVDQTFELFVNH